MNNNNSKTRETTLRLHKDIKQAFEKLSNVKENGVKKYSVDYVLSKVAYDFYRSVKTIENVVFNRTNY